MIESGKLFFDIGVNKGDYTEHLLALNPRQVISIEPDELACKKIRNRFDERVVVVNKAVTDGSKPIVDYFYCEDDNGNSTIDEFWKNSTRNAIEHPDWKYTVKRVETVTIDDLVKQYGNPDFIKIDAEGSEYLILQGMTTPYCNLTFEWVEEKCDQIVLSIQHLSKIGYRHFGVINGDSYSVNPEVLMSDADFIDFMKSKCLPTRKELWGMIFAYIDSEAEAQRTLIREFSQNDVRSFFSSKAFVMGDNSHHDCLSEGMKFIGYVSSEINSSDELWECCGCKKTLRLVYQVQRWRELALPWSSYRICFVQHRKD